MNIFLTQCRWCVLWNIRERERQRIGNTYQVDDPLNCVLKRLSGCFIVSDSDRYLISRKLLNFSFGIRCELITIPVTQVFSFKILPTQVTTCHRKYLTRKIRQFRAWVLFRSSAMLIGIVSQWENSVNSVPVQTNTLRFHRKGQQINALDYYSWICFCPEVTRSDDGRSIKSQQSWVLYTMARTL